MLNYITLVWASIQSQPPWETFSIVLQKCIILFKEHKILAIAPIRWASTHQLLFGMVFQLGLRICLLASIMGPGMP